MNYKDNLANANNDYELAKNISRLLGKVQKYHEVDGLADIVLHELCHDECFGLKKATYLIDNPDFNHLLGVSGFCDQDCCHHKHDMWMNPYTFKDDMKKAQFYNDVKNFLKDSLKKRDIDLANSKDITDLGKILGMKKPEFFSWDMKHGNHGLLIFERSNKPIDDWRSNLLSNFSALLGFCGI